ncbi:MAG: hypothetical protein JSV65_10900 [Armatimonadota bacterium]|nr:MAG: hypothetical protein JSV65_10900 [Armatimonadota bacterium]
MNRPAWLVVLLICLVLASVPASAGLLEYVAAPDPAYGWSYLGDYRYDAFTATVVYLGLTSQVWHEIPWTHIMALIVPDNLDYPDHALLFIGGGSTGNSPGEDELYIGAHLANAIGAPVAVLPAVPNQPLFGGLNEDALIAYTFLRYLDTEDDTWPLLLPMTKSAVKAMDAVAEYASQAWGRDIDNWVVTGGSKRGWTTWLTGAADPVRVKGIAPLVIDTLNIPVQLQHQLDTWGDYSEMIDDYVDTGLVDTLGDEGAPLVAMVDPYAYRDRITMPKLIVNGSNDPYWVIDALNIYWDDLVGPKYVLYDPNSGHGLDDVDRVLNTLSGFFHHVAGGKAFPALWWRHGDFKMTLLLDVKAEPMPEAARIWVAHSADMDFRDETWVATPMTADKQGFSGAVAKSTTENIALFGEADFNIAGRSFTLSTPVRVVPAATGFPPGWSSGTGNATKSNRSDNRFSSAAGRLRAGAAKLTITPDNSNPQYLAGYDDNRLMEGVHDDIWARALYLTDGNEELVLVSLDLIGPMRSDLDEIVAAVAPEVGPNVIITSTHTHSGPDVIGLWGPSWDVPGWDEGYLQYVKDRVAQVIVEAKRNRQPARVLFGSAMTTPEDRIAFNANERWFQADDPPWAPGRGRGPQDYEVSVMRVEARNGSTIATTFNFACHPEVAGDAPDPLVRMYLSSDMAHYAYDEVESTAGGIAIWLQGALGAMVTSDEEEETWAECERIGRALGQRVLEGAAAGELEANPYIAAASRTLDVPLYNDTFYFGMLWGILRNGPGRLVPNGSSPFGVAITTKVSVAQIGSLQIATTPGESYPKIGLNIKQNILTAPHKMVLGVSQDELGYILYPYDYGTAEYGYETSMSAGPTIGLDVEGALAEALADLPQ